MFILRKQFRFEASHQLSQHDGKCRRLHGHSWVMYVEVRSETLIEEGPKDGMVIDYADLKRVVKPLVDDYLDHYHLNDTLEMDQPTSERIAKWVWDRLAKVMCSSSAEAVGFLAVEIEETCTSWCRYEGASR